MKVTEQEIKRFKELNQKVRSGKATDAEIKEAKELAHKIKASGKHKGGYKESKSITNDIEFYTKYPELLRAASNVIFNEVAGTKFNVPVHAANNNVEWPVVGARFDITPVIGKCFEANHPFNYQMRDLWLKLHRAYRGVGTYEYADLGIIIYAIMMAFADIARAERIYGSASKFVAQNRSYPSGLLEAMGLSPSAMAGEKLADFRYQLNRCIAKAGILCLPKGFSAFDLYIRLFGSVFKDSDNIRAQWYLYDSPYRIDYDPTFTTGSSLTYTKRTASSTSSYGTPVQSLDDIIQDINTQLDNLLSDSDVARVCSDILKAFGDNGVQQLIPVPEDFEVIPGRDDVRSLQLHNTVFCGGIAGGGFSSAIFTALGSFTTNEETLRVYQENGVVKQHLYIAYETAPSSYTPTKYQSDGTEYYPTVTSAEAGLFIDGAVPLDTWQDNPTGDDVVEMTRQTLAFNKKQLSVGGNNYDVIEIDNYAAYVVNEVRFLNGDSTPVFGGFTNNTKRYTTLLTAAAVMLVLGQLSRLDWAPRFNAIYSVGGVDTIEATFWDLDNYSLISKEALNRLHDACVLSLFKLEMAPASN